VAKLKLLSQFNYPDLLSQNKVNQNFNKRKNIPKKRNILSIGLFGQFGGTSKNEFFFTFQND
jgi:hypothetical protein